MALVGGAGSRQIDGLCVFCFGGVVTSAICEVCVDVFGVTFGLV